MADTVGGLLAYDALVRLRRTPCHRNISSVSGYSDLTDTSGVILEDEVHSYRKH